MIRRELSKCECGVFSAAALIFLLPSRVAEQRNLLIPATLITLDKAEICAFGVMLNFVEFKFKSCSL